MTTPASSSPSPPPVGASTTAVGGRQTFSSAGGGVTIEFDGRRMRIVSVDPAAGYTAEVAKAEFDRIEVRFRGGSGEAQLRLTVERGRVVQQPNNG
jgi:hypothetical protein